MAIPNLDCFYVRQQGQYAFFEFREGQQTLRFLSPQLAVAYDQEDLLFFMQGAPDEVMRRAAEKRQEYRAVGEPERAERLAVVILPRDHSEEEWTRLANGGQAYLTRFLGKAGLI